MKDLKDMKREDIFNTELIGEGLPDLETEIAKLKSGSDNKSEDLGFGGNESDIFGLGKKSDEDEES